MPDAAEVTSAFAALVAGTGSDPGTALRLSACELCLVAPEQENAVRCRLYAAGPRPTAVELATDEPQGRHRS